MRISRTYSHLCAAEYLLVKRPLLYEELSDLLAVSDWAGGLCDTVSSNGAELKGVRESFESRARQHRWVATSFGCLKQRVVMAFHVPTNTTAVPFDQVLSARSYAYAMDKIDVGVEILPLKSKLIGISPSKNRSTLCFEREVNKISRNARNVPRVPLLLIGVSP